MKVVLKYFYLTLGLVHFTWVNYLSYNVEPYKNQNSLGIKILFSVISLILLAIVYILLIYPKLFKKEKIKTETKIALYVGVIIVSLISLTN